MPVFQTQNQTLTCHSPLLRQLFATLQAEKITAGRLFPDSDSTRRCCARRGLTLGLTCLCTLKIQTEVGKRYVLGTLQPDFYQTVQTGRSVEKAHGKCSLLFNSNCYELFKVCSHFSNWLSLLPLRFIYLIYTVNTHTEKQRERDVFHSLFTP